MYSNIITENLEQFIILSMHNLKTNFDKFLSITNSFFFNIISEFDNFQSYIRDLKVIECQIISLYITAESIGIDSGNHFFMKLKSDHANVFPNLIDRCNFKRWRKRLYTKIDVLNRVLATFLNEKRNTYIVDSILVSVCQIVCEEIIKICREYFESTPDKRYSAVCNVYYYSYKLHLVTTLRSVFVYMDTRKTSVHDLHYLSNNQILEIVH